MLIFHILGHNNKIQQQLYRGVDFRDQSEIQGQSKLNHNNYGGAAEGRPSSVLSFHCLWLLISFWVLRYTPTYICWCILFQGIVMGAKGADARGVGCGWWVGGRAHPTNLILLL